MLDVLKVILNHLLVNLISSRLFFYIMSRLRIFANTNFLASTKDCMHLCCWIKNDEWFLNMVLWRLIDKKKMNIGFIIQELYILLTNSTSISIYYLMSLSNLNYCKCKIFFPLNLSSWFVVILIKNVYFSINTDYIPIATNNCPICIHLTFILISFRDIFFHVIFYNIMTI